VPVVAGVGLADAFGRAGAQAEARAAVAAAPLA